MEFEILGGPEGGPSLDLDHEQFAYAGKFVVSTTGKAVGRDGGTIVAAASFDRDRTDDAVVRIRYVTVRADRRGDGLGPRLLAFLAERVLEDAREVRIAVNNPFAYEAAYKAGFGYTGERTGVAELELARPAERSRQDYQRGLDAFRDGGDLARPEREFLANREGAAPPSPVTDATGG